MLFKKAALICPSFKSIFSVKKRHIALALQSWASKLFLPLLLEEIQGKNFLMPFADTFMNAKAEYFILNLEKWHPVQYYDAQQHGKWWDRC
jgi:hypothetical protein